ncbi:Golgi-associated plant pathogenesis-related protein 1, partial [Habropoda laboriosa]
PLNFVEGFLRLHNEYRTIHGSPPLQIDDQLNEVAQEWAVSLLKRGVLEYKSDPEYGENIYLSLPRVLAHEIKPEDPLEDWYREGRYFKYGVEEVKGLEGVRHFTQLVWKDTKLIGLGLAKDIDEERAFFVCVYQPPGNVSGEFAENVLPVPQVNFSVRFQNDNSLESFDEYSIHEAVIFLDDSTRRFFRKFISDR